MNKTASILLMLALVLLVGLATGRHSSGSDAITAGVAEYLAPSPVLRSFDPEIILARVSDGGEAKLWRRSRRKTHSPDVCVHHYEYYLQFPSNELEECMRRVADALRSEVALKGGKLGGHGRGRNTAHCAYAAGRIAGDIMVTGTADAQGNIVFFIAIHEYRRAS